MPCLQSTRWCFTLNNFTPDEYANIKKLECKYSVIGKEVGDHGGTPHLQGFIIFKKKLSLSGVKKLLPRAHLEVAKGTSVQAADYCKKDGDYDEMGEVPSQGKRTDLEAATDLIREGASMLQVAESCPTTFVKFGRGLRDLKLTLDKPYTPSGLRGEWYWGAPGTGKSRKAREENPDAFLKSQNKWFDGYNGESVIILDDMDTNVLGHYLKIWADRYPCTGETKGGTINLSHDKFIITSNYSIEGLWPDDEEMQTAISRRFHVTHFNPPL